MKRLIGVLLSVVIIIGLVSVVIISKQKQEDQIVTIGLSIDNLVIERWQKDQEIFRASAMAAGAEVIVMNAYEDNDT